MRSRVSRRSTQQNGERPLSDAEGGFRLKKLLLLVLMCLLGASLVPLAHAGLTYDIMPTSGLSTQSILVSVRNDPITGDYKQYVYVFIDGIMVKDRVLCVDLKNSNYRYLWDLSFVPPKGANGYGQHRITIWVETEFGLRKTLYYTYTITDGLPGTVDSWELYIAAHPEILTQIQGPKGDQGNTGAAGDRGAKGDTGTRGPAAQIDYNALWLSVPPDVLAQLKGEPGTPGAQGEPASLTLLGIGVGLGVMVSVIFTVFYAKRREGTQ